MGANKNNKRWPVTGKNSIVTGKIIEPPVIMTGMRFKFISKPGITAIVVLVTEVLMYSKQTSGNKTTDKPLNQGYL